MKLITGIVAVVLGCICVASCNEGNPLGLNNKEKIVQILCDAASNNKQEIIEGWFKCYEQAPVSQFFILSLKP